MTRHNLAIHISWLLSTEVTPPVGVHAVPTASATVSTISAETIYAEYEEEDIEEQIPSQSPTPSPNRRIPFTVNVAAGFQRPRLPPKINPNPPLRESPNTFAEESMGRLSSASRSARPGLVSQHQLATPASTTGSTLTSSLMQGYSALLRANNGELRSTIDWGSC
jgi:bloom syndrome protein